METDPSTANSPPAPVADRGRRLSMVLWTAVAVGAVLLAVVIGVRVLSGATTPAKSFAFEFGAPACDCARITQYAYGFPASATIHFHWWVTWVGTNASAQMAVQKASGKLVYIAVSEYQEGNPYNLNETWAQGGSGTFSGRGTPFTFVLDLVATPDFLPADTSIWVNGTYTTPLL